MDSKFPKKPFIRGRLLTGFTLIELVVTTFIISLLTVLILPNYRFGDSQFALQRAVHKMTQDMRRTQEMSMSTREFQGQIPSRYGIEFAKNRDYYILFADINDNGTYEIPDLEVERIFLEKGVKIQDLLTPFSSQTVWVAFKPPDPLTSILDPIARSTLIIQLNNANNQIRTASVNGAGLIAVE